MLNPPWRREIADAGVVRAVRVALNAIALAYPVDYYAYRDDLMNLSNFASLSSTISLFFINDFNPSANSSTITILESPANEKKEVVAYG